MTKTLATVVAAAAVASTLAAAPAFADRVDQRQSNQANRIEQGLRDGSLTRQEAARLKDEQARIAKLEREAERDGRITREERARLGAAQNRASRNIYEERHDSESRNRWNRWGSRSSHNDGGYRGYWSRRWW